MNFHYLVTSESLYDGNISAEYGDLRELHFMNDCTTDERRTMAAHNALMRSEK